MGFFPSRNPTSREIPQVRQEFDNPSIIIHFFHRVNWVFLAYFEEILFASNPGLACVQMITKL